MTGNLDNQSMKAPPGKFVSVYVTAKLIHAHMLVEIRKEWPKLYFTARWPLTAVLPSESAKPATLWTQDNETDMSAARVVVGYSHEDEASPLKDPLWELGEAHAMRKPIYLVGPVERFGKYAFCSSIAGRYQSLAKAFTEISHLNNYDSHVDRLADKIDGMTTAISDEVVARIKFALGK